MLLVFAVEHMLLVVVVEHTLLVVVVVACIVVVIVQLDKKAAHIHLAAARFAVVVQ